MAHFLYIIRSEKADSYYIGETINVIDRLAQHNSGFFKGSFTKQADDWTLLKSIEFKNISNARNAEKFIKKMKSRKFIEQLIIEHLWLLDRFDL